MGTIRERQAADGSTRYLAIVRLKGAKPATKQFHRKTDAKRWIQDTESAFRDGRDFPRRESLKRTFADLCDRYAEDVLTQKRESTQATQRPQLAWWRGELGHHVLRDVTVDVVSEALRRLASTPSTTGRTRSPSTVNRWHALVSHVLNSGVRWGWLDDNPARKLHKNREPRGRVRWLDGDERRRLLDACADGPAWFRAAVLVLMTTGLRLGELKRLRWGDLDLQRRSLVVHESKNDERRAVQLAAPALHALRAWSKVRRLDDDRVFPSAAHNFHRAWYPAVERAELADVRVHDLRHTCASLLIMSGASLATVAAVLGHKQIEVTRRYAHLSDRHTRDAMAAMSSEFFG